MRIEAGKTAYIGELKLTIGIAMHEKRSIPGSTATHEAMHVVGALENGTGVESATIIPGDGYLGLTKLSKPDAVAAMAPHSMGASGTGYDVYIAGLMGNAGFAQSAARGIIQSNMDKVQAVAMVLEEKRTITSGDIYSAIGEIENPKFKEVKLSIETKDGEKSEEKVEVRDNIVIIPGQLVEIYSSKVNKSSLPLD